jgi:ribulose-5-phosphate 4-epimerase/fuculose-1-phosphate aldolase
MTYRSRLGPFIAGVTLLTLLAISHRPASAQSPPMPAESGGPVSHEAIADLVAANHILAKLGVLDGFGHVTVRHPGNPQRYLMSRSLAPALVAADDIMEYDLDSNPIDARGRSASIERFIHGEIYKLRPDVNAVVHSHSPTVIPFSVSKTPLRPLYHVAGFLSPAVPVYDPRATVGMSHLLIVNRQLGKALAETLGGNSVVLIRGHGNAVVAANVGLVTFRAVYTEVNARLLLQARTLDGPITFLDPEEAAKADEVHQRVYGREWELWKRELLGKK